MRDWKERCALNSEEIVACETESSHWWQKLAFGATFADSEAIVSKVSGGLGRVHAAYNNCEVLWRKLHDESV
jgi:hypothetical protein